MDDDAIPELHAVPVTTRSFQPLQQSRGPVHPVAPVIVAWGTAHALAALLTALHLWRFYTRAAEALGRAPTDAEKLAFAHAFARDPVGLLTGHLSLAYASALVALVAGIRSPEHLEGALRAEAPPGWTAWGVVASLGAVGLGLMLTALSLAAGVHGLCAPWSISDVVCHASLDVRVSAMVLVGVATPVAEELLVRGLVLTRLTQRWGPRVAAVLAAALSAFAAMALFDHAFAFVPALYFGAVSLRTGTVRTAALAHVVFNVTGMVLPALLPASATQSPMGAVVPGVAGLVLLVASLGALTRAPRVES